MIKLNPAPTFEHEVFQTVPGQNYVVQYADGLPSTNWMELAGGVGNGLQQSTTDKSAGGTPKRFYRIGANSAWTIQSMNHSKGNFKLRFPTVAGRSYVVQWAEDPASTNWVELVQVAGNGTVRTITDDTMGGAPKRFYRVEVRHP